VRAIPGVDGVPSELCRPSVATAAAAPPAAEAGPTTGPNLDLERFQQDYLDELPRDHGSHSYIGRGLYWPQMEMLFSEFDREQVLVLTLEQLSGKTAAGATTDVMQKVFRFLQLPDQVVIVDTAPKNTRDYEPMPAELRTKLAAFYEPYNQRLYGLLGVDFGWA
jgi:hypothetical protein